MASFPWGAAPYHRPVVVVGIIADALVLLALHIKIVGLEGMFNGPLGGWPMAASGSPIPLYKIPSDIEKKLHHAPLDHHIVAAFAA